MPQRGRRRLLAGVCAVLMGPVPAWSRSIATRGPEAQAADTLPVLRQASGHPMRYWLSLPRQWTPGRRWPVVVTLDGGNKAWLTNAEGFARERNRRNYSFILVTPEILSNGGTDLRHMAEYHYASSVWDEVERTGRCRFDVEGLHAILADVQRQYGGERTYFVTGWSAGGHLTWALVFREPERLRAAALSGANFNGRCLTNEVPHAFPVSRAPERTRLPVKLFEGSDDPALTSPQPIAAMRLASENGYATVSRDTIQGMPHSPMPEQVLRFFNSLVR